MDFYTIALVFLAAVVYQTIAKKIRLPLLSNGLDWTKDRAIGFFTWFGEAAGRWLNIYDWIKNIVDFFEKVWRFIKDYVIEFFEKLWRWVCDFFEGLWRFIVDHLWGNIKPFFESVAEIVSPAWKLMFSWGYFFVGFAKTHYIFFSYAGGVAVVTVTAYFTESYWVPLVVGLDPRYLGGAALAAVIGLLVAYPNILPEMFPRAKKTVENIGRAIDEEHVVVNGVRHNTRDLRRWNLTQLTELLEEAGSTNRGLARSKNAYIQRLLASGPH